MYIMNVNAVAIISTCPIYFFIVMFHLNEILLLFILHKSIQLLTCLGLNNARLDLTFFNKFVKMANI